MTIIQGTINNDSLDVQSDTTSISANSGVDTAVFSGNYADYTFSQSDSYVSLMTHNTTGQVVSLFGVEYLQFDNGLIEFVDKDNGSFKLDNNASPWKYSDVKITSPGNDGVSSKYLSSVNEFSVVWFSEFDNEGIYIKGFNELGNVVIDETQVDSNSYTEEGSPDIAILRDGNYVATWMAYHNDGTYYGIYAQKIDQNGDFIGDETKVNTYDSARQLGHNYPSISALHDGGLIITYTSRGQDDYGDGIYAQRFDVNLNKIGDEFQIEKTGIYPDITTLNNGHFVVAWQSDNQDGSGIGIFSQIYNTGAGKVGSEFRVNTYTQNNQTNPSIATLKDDGFVITWSSYNQDGSDYGIYAQLYNNDGSLAGNEFQVNTRTYAHQSGSSVTGLADGGFVIVWNSEMQEGGRDKGTGVYAQRFNSDSTLNGDEFHVNSYINGDQGSAKVVGLGNGGFIVTWKSENKDNSDYDLYAQRYDSDGSALGEVALNAIPEITSIAIATVDEDSEYSYQFTVDDLDVLDTVSLSADSIPSWLSFDASTGVLSGTPENDDVGVHNIILNSAIVQQVADDVSLAQEFTVTVANTNDTPTVSTAIADASTDEDTAYSYDTSANFTDVDTGDGATYIATLAGDSALPSWLSITSAGVLSGTPLNADVGLIDIKVTRTDTAGESATDTFVLTVVNTNDAPVAATSPQITMNTSLGTIVFELNAELAPITVENILDYVNSDFYDDTLFHRVIPDFMVQGGGFTTGMVNSPTNDPIILESDNGLSNLRGAIAMARTSTPDSATSQFFINLVDNSFLDYQSVSNPGYAVFGEVVSGLSVIDSIAQVSTTTVGGYQNVPLTDVVISSFQQTSLGQINDTSINEDAAYSYDASAHFTDVDIGDTLTYSATLSGGSALPSWITINSSTGLLSGTPGNNDVGTTDVTVTATDTSNTSIFDTYTLTVDNTNDAPILSGVFAGSIVEGDTNNLVNTVVIDDIDIGDVLDISLDTLIGNYGSVSFSSDFEWSYALNNGNSEVIKLATNETLTDAFVLSVSDGIETISKNIDITVQGKDAIFKIGTLSPQTIDANNPNIDLTLDSDEIVEDAMIKSGYTSSVGLTSAWNTNTNT
ncbi:MAG: hypothetical protein HOC17_01755, partial [Candidatus Ruthia sp.]|nr:hypothetical protein [Candidatus Ruthturnera sp.]